jgi:hypothetical protein
MANRFTDLVTGSTPLGRAPFFLSGAGFLLAKHAFDWAVAAAWGRPWSPFVYFVLPAPVFRLVSEPWGGRAVPMGDRSLLVCLLTLALPFIVVGVRLTARRLRDAGLPVWLVVFFFVPVVNLVFFLLLCILPGRAGAFGGVPAGDAIALVGADAGRHAPVPGGPVVGPFADVAAGYQDTYAWQRLRAAHRRITRDRPAGNAVVSLSVCVPVTVGFVILAANVLKNYGAGLFVGVPFCLGLGSVVLYGLAKPQPFGASMGVAFLAATLAGLCLLLFALEGAICLIMAAPIWYGLTLFGAVVGFAIQARPWSAGDNPLVLLALLAVAPSLIAAESAARPEPQLIKVVSAVEIDAPAETVWQNVIAFPPLAEPDDWVFHTGIAYPIRAEIEGWGPGAIRQCVFSTGSFVEPIEVWDEPARLAFRVEDQPEPMREWAPYTIHPPHLHGFLVSHRGEFKLTPLPDGRTRLHGTTWYTNKMWPAAYWQLWSDAVIHRIHLRVLRHIQALSENEA